MPRRRGAPRERAGERSSSPSRGKGLRPPHPQAVVRELPKRLPTARGGPGQDPQSPAPGSRCLRAAPRSLHPAAPDPCRRDLFPFPHRFSAPRKSLAPARGLGVPHSPRGERSRSGRRAREQRAAAAGGGGASAELLTAAPAAPAANRAGKGEAAPGCHLPALPPSRVTPRSTAPAGRQVPARGGREEPAALPERAPRLRSPPRPDPRSVARYEGLRATLGYGV